jgi:acetylornithine/succinyldiaminopimelate/putrescine aminotransferase
MSEHYGVQADMLITGKGLGGGIYPVSAVLTTPAIYDRCMNEDKYGYLSSMGGNPLAAIIATKVLEVTRRAGLLANVGRIEQQLREGFLDLCERYPAVFVPATVLGAIGTIGLQSRAHGQVMARELFRRGVYCHSVSLVEPLVVKFFPPLVSERQDIEELLSALDEFAKDATG